MSRLNREELLTRLWLLGGDGGDKEADHLMADTLLLEYIGDTEITEAFDAIGKWYA